MTNKYQEALEDITQKADNYLGDNKSTVARTKEEQLLALYKAVLQELIDKTTFTCSCGNTVIIGQGECDECKLLFAWEEIERDCECDE